MVDQVQVLPRYTEGPRPAAETAAIPAAVNCKGILTSMYDNKIIVLCIIVVIILIGIIAFVVYKKSDTKSSPPPKKPEAAAKPPTDSANPPAPAAATAVDGGDLSKGELMGLLARSKNNENTNGKNDASAGSSNINVNSKTDEEIMQLMEDEDRPESAAIPNAQPEQLPGGSTPSNNTTTNPQVTNPEAPLTCSAIIPPGRRCRNRVRSDGKCIRHGG